MITVHSRKQFVIIHSSDPPSFVSLTWPEANALQADLRKLLIAEGITMRDAYQ